MKQRSSQENRVVLDGEYDLGRKDELIAVLADLTRSAPATIDLSHVTYVDSTFLTVMAGLLKRFQEVPITLLGANPNLKRVLGLMQFDKVFRLVDEE